MKLFRNGSIDQTLFVGAIKQNVKDVMWQSRMTSAVGACFTDINKNRAGIIATLAGAPFKVTETQCNVLPVALSACVHVKIFAVRNLSKV